MNRTVNNILIFLTAASVGTIFGILYAPDKGSNTRDKLTFRLDRLKRRLEELLDQLVKGKDLYQSEAKSEGQKVISDARGKSRAITV